LTGGGLAPALNPTLYGIIDEARKNDYQVYGGMFGWHCFLPEGKVVDLTAIDIDSIKNQGGTFLRSSRTNLFNISNGFESLKAKVKELGIGCIVAVGGNDTLGSASYICRNLDIPVIGVPKTIDNDLFETYWSPGYPTAAKRLADMTFEIKIDAAYSLSRVFIIECLGLDAGWLAAASSYGGADLIIPPEREAKIDKVLELVNKKYRDNGGFAVVVMAHQVNFDKLESGIKDDNSDSFNTKRKIFTSLSLRDAVKKNLGFDCKALLPGNYIQSGAPIAVDRESAIELGRRAIVEVERKNFGIASCLKRVTGTNRITVEIAPLEKLVGDGETRKLDDSLFDFDNYQIKHKFVEYLEPILGPFNSKFDSYTKLIQKLM